MAADGPSEGQARLVGEALDGPAVALGKLRDRVSNLADWLLRLETDPALTPGAREGLTFWFSLAAHGSDAYTAAVEACLAAARDAPEQIRRAEHLELLREPELSVVAFRRVGWTDSDYVR